MLRTVRVGLPPKHLKALTPAMLANCGVGKKYAGVFSAAGRACGLSGNSIRKAAMGVTRSQVCLSALYAAIAAVDAVPTPEVFSESELVHIRRGGKWHGLVAQVAKAENSSYGNVFTAASGKSKSLRLLRALREAAAKADAESEKGSAK